MTSPAGARPWQPADPFPALAGHADFIKTREQVRLEGLVDDRLNESRFCGGG